MARRQVTDLKVRLYSGQDDDLLRWLAQFDSQPYGAKTQAVKEAQRRPPARGERAWPGNDGRGFAAPR